jgi:hypothetical protein
VTSANQVSDAQSWAKLPRRALIFAFRDIALMKPVISGRSTAYASSDERAFFADCAPRSYILFGCNIETRQQVRVDGWRRDHGGCASAGLIDPGRWPQ